jgi:hypothetical protein
LRNPFNSSNTGAASGRCSLSAIGIKLDKYVLVVTA